MKFSEEKKFVKKKLKEIFWNILSSNNFILWKKIIQI